jgi:hypothetical protein
MPSRRATRSRARTSVCGRQLARGSFALMALTKVSALVECAVTVQSSDGSVIRIRSEFRAAQVTSRPANPVYSHTEPKYRGHDVSRREPST